MSLNRAPIAVLPDLPDLPVDPGVIGQVGYELVSAAAVAGLVRARHGKQQRLGCLHCGLVTA